MFIHVGKTGGETVRHTLKITCRMRKNPIEQQKCWETFQFSNGTQKLEESLLSQHTIGVMHTDLILPKKSLERSTTLLWTIRNPLTRIISWFKYTSPANCNLITDSKSTACNTNRTITNNLLKETEQESSSSRLKWETKFYWYCFPTLQDFANALGENNDIHTSTTTTTLNCSELAWKTLLGKASPSSSHAHFNYEYYWNQAIENNPSQDREIWAIRTEHLWADMDKIEMMLMADDMTKPSSTTTSSSFGNQVSTTVTTVSKEKQRRRQLEQQRKDVTHGSEGHLQRGGDDLSSRQRKYLCCALRDEILVYEKLTMRATNLNREAKNESLSSVVEECMFKTELFTSSTTSSSCPSW